MISQSKVSKSYNLFHAFCGLLLGCGMVGASGYYLLRTPMTRAELVERCYVALFGLVLFLGFISAAARKMWLKSKTNLNGLQYNKTPEYNGISGYLKSSQLWLPALLTLFGVFLFGLFSWLVLHGVLEIRSVGTLQIFFLLVGLTTIFFSAIAAFYYMIRK